MARQPSDFEGFPRFAWQLHPGKGDQLPLRRPCIAKASGKASALSSDRLSLDQKTEPGSRPERFLSAIKPFRRYPVGYRVERKKLIPEPLKEIRRRCQK